MLDKQVIELEVQIKAWHRDSELSRKLEQIPGIGPVTASALVATIGDAKSFENGRQLAAWMGLVPKQHSTGGKSRLQGISKRGDTYLRTLLIHGARSAILAAHRNCLQWQDYSQLTEQTPDTVDQRSSFLHIALTCAVHKELN